MKVIPGPPLKNHQWHFYVRIFINKKIERAISTNQVDIRKTGKGVRPVMNKNRFRYGILMQ